MPIIAIIAGISLIAGAIAAPKVSSDARAIAEAASRTANEQGTNATIAAVAVSVAVGIAVVAFTNKGLFNTLAKK